MTLGAVKMHAFSGSLLAAGLLAPSSMRHFPVFSHPLVALTVSGCCSVGSVISLRERYALLG